MRYLFIFFSLLLFGAGCTPTPSDVAAVNIPDTLQHLNNISTLYGSGGKNTTDNNGQMLASNIIWKDSLGITRSLDSLRGKIILLNFWAIWCLPCETEMPDLNSIAQTTNSDIVVIGVSAIDPSSSLFDRTKLYVTSHGLKFQIVTDQASKVYLNYGGDGTLPWSFAIDRNGFIVYKFIGQQTKKQFMDILSQIP